MLPVLSASISIDAPAAPIPFRIKDRARKNRIASAVIDMSATITQQLDELVDFA
ncbi:hypothetical protein [Xanthomonas arboricola]|uniref:hypothetical protein n=1 Tax=Xanthomonas arboricola TaxID=56448 RepID=UPI000B11DDE0|nr:hypothetical protein [Xanthomonas arboricola]